MIDSKSTHLGTTTLVLACALSLGMLAPAQGLPDAATLLDAMDADTAFAEVRANVKTLLATGTVKAMGMTARFQEAFIGGRRAKMTTTHKLGSSTMGITGQDAWSSDPAMGIYVAANAEERGRSERLFQVIWRAPWRSMYASAKTVGDKEVGKRPCWRIEMTSRDGVKEHWYLDKETKRLARFDTEIPDMMGGTTKARFYYGDWRRQDGVLYPFQREQKIGLMSVNYQWESCQVNADVADQHVDPSEKVVAAIKKRRAEGGRKSDPEACTLIDLEKQHVATIRVTIKPEDVARTLAVALPEVMKHVTKEGATIAGPPFSRYHKRSDDQFELEAGIPVAAPIREGGRVKASTLPGGKAATVWHIGKYHDLPKSYAKLEAWMKSRNHDVSAAFWEVYWTDPGLEPDPRKWKTQIIWPIK